jgi:hypothetical protein
VVTARFPGSRDPSTSCRRKITKASVKAGDLLERTPAPGSDPGKFSLSRLEIPYNPAPICPQAVSAR